MRFLVMGPPGSGKGTQAAILSDMLQIPHISTGEMFRDAIKTGSELGELAAGYINKGELVPDTITEAIVKERLSQEDCQEGYLLDGFPRTLEQGKALDTILRDVGKNIDCVINLDVPIGDIVDRLTARRICGVCGAVYHLEEKKPLVEGICNFCGGSIVQRADDSEETVRKRLDIYLEATKPLVGFYQDKGLLCSIVGNLSIEETTHRIMEDCLEGMKQ